MNEPKKIELPEAPTEICFVCKKPVEYVLRDDWQDRISKLPFSLTGNMKTMLSFERKTHDECADRIEEENRREKIEFEKKRRQEAVRNSVTEYRSDTRLPKDFAEKTFDTYMVGQENGKAVAMLKAWREGDDFGFLILGPSGTGKSHLGFALINAYLDNLCAKVPEVQNPDLAMARPTMPHYVSAAEMLAEIKRGESWEIGYRTLHSPLLLLDDIGSENITDWSREVFFRLFEHRINKRLPTVVTTNLSLNELKERMHERVVSRILGLCIPVQIKGTDKRRDIMNDRTKLLAERMKGNL